MPRFNLFSPGAWDTVCLLAGLAFFASPARAQYDPDWTRNLRIGAIGGLNIKADFRMTGQFNVTGADPGPTGVSGANHFYDDGYVRVDKYPTPRVETTYWGYQKSSQYDDTTHTLLMHSSTSFESSSASKSEDSAFAGFELAYGGTLHHWGWKRIGWDFGFGLLPISLSDEKPISATVNRNVYSFSVPADVLVIQPAPYNGGPAGSGTQVINNIATAAGTDTVTESISGTRSLDVMLYTLRLGPTLFLDLNPRWGVSIGVGPAVGIVSGDYEFDERIGLTSNKGKISTTDVVYGGYVNAMVMYHAMDHGDLYLGAQYMPMESSTISGQGRQARLNLSGQVYVSAGINWPF